MSNEIPISNCEVSRPPTPERFVDADHRMKECLTRFTILRDRISPEPRDCPSGGNKIEPPIPTLGEVLREHPNSQNQTTAEMHEIIDSLEQILFSS